MRLVVFEPDGKEGCLVPRVREKREGLRPHMYKKKRESFSFKTSDSIWPSLLVLKELERRNKKIV